MVRPSRRREMARRAVQDCGVSIRMACEAFRVSQTCYRYVAKADAENEEIANWLLRLTDNHRNWGSLVCASCICAMFEASAGTTSVCTGSIESSLNLRIKPRKRLMRLTPEPLTVPTNVNQVWSMDFMHDQLADGRSIRVLNVIDDFNREALVTLTPN